jgi:hypothetical protein
LNIVDIFSRNYIPTIRLASWPLSCEMFDVDLIAGPVPTMFAEDPDMTKEALKEDHYRAHFDMAKFLRVFLQPEHVDLGESFEIVNEPR